MFKSQGHEVIRHTGLHLTLSIDEATIAVKSAQTSLLLPLE